MPRYRNLVFLPQEFIDLQEELSKHPELVAELEGQCDSFESALGILAAKFNVVLDGQYNGDDLKGIAKMLTNKLRGSNAMILVPPTLLQ